MKLSPSNRRIAGITLAETTILILIIAFFVLWVTIANFGTRETTNNPNVRCLRNANSLWKATTAWGLDPAHSWRSIFPETNLSMALALDNAGITPDMFICPYAERDGINRRGKISPASNLITLGDTNSNYNFFSGWSDRDGDKVVICDKDGADTNGPIDADPFNGRWGGNHLANGRPAGGHIILVAGHAMWIGTTNDSSQHCITNPAVRASFDPGTKSIVRFGH